MFDDAAATVFAPATGCSSGDAVVERLRPLRGGRRIEWASSRAIVLVECARGTRGCGTCSNCFSNGVPRLMRISSIASGDVACVSTGYDVFMCGKHCVLRRCISDRRPNSSNISGSSSDDNSAPIPPYKTRSGDCTRTRHKRKWCKWELTWYTREASRLKADGCHGASRQFVLRFVSIGGDALRLRQTLTSRAGKHSNTLFPLRKSLPG